MRRSAVYATAASACQRVNGAGRLAILSGAFFALGVLLVAPTGALAQSTPTTFTSSTSSSTTFSTSARTDRVDTFETRITARLDGGATVFDQTFNVAYGDAAVVAALAAAQAALNAAVDPDPAIVGPLLVLAATILVDANTATIDTPTGSVETITEEIYLGPTSAIIGNRDLGGTLFIVESQTTNINENTHTTFLVDRLLLTTETYLTSEHYEFVGYPRQVAAVPGPATMLLLGAGLLGLGLVRRRA